ncbi:MAG: UbiA family prenyltransferase [Alphaproteobacteria bacterium]|nr:UbiA family prenyltransferase [Alphaproteobacteria bacterium]
MTYLRSMRPHQWVKNTLLFLPAILANDLGSETLVPSIAAFVAFCLLASGVYVFNDLMDVETDRAHPRKCQRPFAAGDIPIRHGYRMAPALFLTGLALAAWLGPATLLIAVAYVGLTTAYSLWLKHIFLVDICTLSGLYALRVAAGAAAASLPLSWWLLAFCIAFFFSLASVKRLVELSGASAEVRPAGSGHEYVGRNGALVEGLAIGAGVAAIVLLIAYLLLVPSVALFATPLAKWTVCVVLAGWLLRITLAARRGAFQDDPIMFTVTDWVSWACFATIVLMAIFG